MERKETQRKILLLDILNVLIEIGKQALSDDMEIYQQCHDRRDS